jgi:ankyrin repeat protein
MEAVTSEEHIPDEDVCAIVRSLLHAGADAQARAVYEDEVETVLEAAIWRGSIELIQLLLDSGAPITESALFGAAWDCNLNIVKLLVRSGARVTESVIGGAAKKDKPELVMFLLDSAEDSIKERGRSAALISAIRYGNKDVIDALDASGVHLHRTAGLPAAMAAVAKRGDISVFQLLLGDNSRYRASVIESLDSPLPAAIAKGQNHITKMLLAAGAAVNAVNDEGYGPPLLEAIRRKDAHLAQRLLAAGAAVNRENPDSNRWLRCNFTVLPAAVAWGYHPLIRSIISAGAEVNAPESEGGKTALVVAVEKRDAVTIQILIDAGADVNAPTAVFFGYTALEAAVRNNDIDMVDYLLGIGADTDEGSLIAAVDTSMELMQMLLTARLRRYPRVPKG